MNFFSCAQNLVMLGQTECVTWQLWSSDHDLGLRQETWSSRHDGRLHERRKDPIRWPGVLESSEINTFKLLRIKDPAFWLIKSLLIKQMQVSYIWFSCSKFNRRVNIKYINAFVSNEFLKQDYAQNSKNSLLILWNQTFHFYIKTINRESFLMKHLVLK